MNVGVILDEMPRDCNVCPLFHSVTRGETVYMFCYGIDDSVPNSSDNGVGIGLIEINHSYDDESPEAHGGKPDWCPLQEVEPVRRGHWVKKNGEKVCSNCNWIGDPLRMFGKIMWSYCPYCGAKMEVEV